MITSYFNVNGNGNGGTGIVEWESTLQSRLHLLGFNASALKPEKLLFVVLNDVVLRCEDKKRL